MRMCLRARVWLMIWLPKVQQYATPALKVGTRPCVYMCVVAQIQLIACLLRSTCVCVFVCVCVCVCVCACVRACVRVRARACMRVRVRACVRRLGVTCNQGRCMYVCVRARVRVRARACVLCLCVFSRARACVRGRQDPVDCVSLLLRRVCVCVCVCV